MSATPKEIGVAVYQVQNEALASRKAMSYRDFLRSLKVDPESLPFNHMVEITIGLLFSAYVVYYEQLNQRAADEATQAMIDAFCAHARELGATEDDIVALRGRIALRISEYNRSFEDDSGLGSIGNLAKRFYWNVVGREEHSAQRVFLAGVYLGLAMKGTRQALSRFKVLA